MEGTPTNEIDIRKDDYIIDEDENWNLRPDIAGYEYIDEGTNWRIGIVRDVITADNISQKLSAITDILKTEFDLSPGHKITRNMARVVITKDQLLKLPKEVLETTESLIPLQDSGNEDVSDCYQAIFCTNHESRVTPKETMKDEMEKADIAFKKGYQTYLSTDRSERQKNDGITFERVTSNSPPEIIEAYKKMLVDTFGELPEDLEEQIEDTSYINMVALDSSSGKPVVIGASYAFHDVDNIKRGDKHVKLSAYDISGAKVDEKYSGRKIYKRLQMELLKNLARRKNVDFVFGYSTAENLKVFNVAGQVGRSLTAHTARVLNLPIHPANKQGWTDGKLVDEIVTYMPGKTLQLLYGSQPKATPY